MKCLMILNDAPYGTERSYNGLRLARTLLKTGEAEVVPYRRCGHMRQKRAEGTAGLLQHRRHAGHGGAQRRRSRRVRQLP